MADQFVKITQQGWGERLKSSFAGIVFGLVLGIAAFPVLFLNEGRAVKRQQSLEEGAGVVISIESDRVEPALEEKLVHVTGTAEVRNKVEDEKFGISAEAIKLSRSVEMYQWVEDEKTSTKNKVGGGTETVTTKSYQKKWDSSLNKSSQFEKPEGHQNPESMPYKQNSWIAEEVSLGVFQLPKFLVSQIGNAKAISVSSLDELAEGVREIVKLDGGGLYVGEDPSNPEIGDIRIRFSAVMPTDISVVAKQVGDSFEKYRTVAGGELEILAMGTQSADAMFEDEQSANKMLTWILRGVGLLLMTIGVALITRPLKVVADVLPIAGKVVGAGLGFFAFALAMVGSTITIATAWIFYRPVIGISVLVITGFFIFLIIWKMRKAKPPELEMDEPPALG